MLKEEEVEEVVVAEEVAEDLVQAERYRSVARMRWMCGGTWSRG